MRRIIAVNGMEGSKRLGCGGEGEQPVPSRNLLAGTSFLRPYGFVRNQVSQATSATPVTVGSHHHAGRDGNLLTESAYVLIQERRVESYETPASCSSLPSTFSAAKYSEAISLAARQCPS